MGERVVRTMDEPRWYAVLTGPRCEDLADRHLRRQGYWTFYPFCRVKRFRKMPNQQARTIEHVARPYFSRYLFVALRGDQSLFAVNETPGVSTVVYFGDHPLEVPHGVMDDIIGQASMEKQEDGSERFGLIEKRNEVDPRVDSGTRFRFKENTPFAGLIAQVRVDNGSKIRVWLESLGAVREISVSREAIGEIIISDAR